MKKIILGLVALSSVAMAADNTATAQVNNNGTKGTFSNRFGFSYVADGHEDFDHWHGDPDVFKESYELDYKLLYNVTDRFRWGGELGLDASHFSSDVTKNNSTSEFNGALLLGVTAEYDVYQSQNAAFYINGSLGGAGGKTDVEDNHGRKVGSVDANSYLKFGIGARFNNGLGLELGRRAMSYDIHVAHDSDTMYRGQTYVQVNYTF